MPSDAMTLQKAIVSIASANTPLVALLGGAKIYDRPPDGVALPYVTLGATRMLDASTASEAASEHLLTLHAWSRNGGRKEAAQILNALSDALEAHGAVYDGMRIVSLIWRGIDIRHDADVSAYHGVIRFRAITEDAAI